MTNHANKKTINDVPMREAETKEEKLLLGLIHQEAERIGWGQIVLELTIKNGQLTIVKSKEVSRTFNVGGFGS